MKNVYLFCNAGMSTSILVKKMQEAAKERNFDCHIEAFAVSEAKEKGKDADILLLGPQVRYQVNSVKADFPDKPVESIDMLAYGMMDGAKVIDTVISIIGDK